MSGPFTPDLHPHGWHGHWDITGGVINRLKGAKQALNHVNEVGSKETGRSRTRPGSGRAYARGPARHLPTPAHMKPVAHGVMQPGAMIRIHVGKGAGRHVTSGRIVTHRQSNGVHHVKVATSHGVKNFQLRHPAENKVKLHTSRGNNLPRPSAYVDHQAIQQWWAGRHSHGATLPEGLPRPPKRQTLHKDDGTGAMTVTEDLGHDGQSPVTVLQGGSRLARCPECQRKLTMDGYCPEHGVVTKGLRTGGAVLLQKEASSVIPSTGEALPGNTINAPTRTKRKPKENTPVPSACPDCGGTDGYHDLDCPRRILNPGAGAAGFGA